MADMISLMEQFKKLNHTYANLSVKTCFGLFNRIKIYLYYFLVLLYFNFNFMRTIISMNPDALRPGMSPKNVSSLE